MPGINNSSRQEKLQNKLSHCTASFLHYLQYERRLSPHTLRSYSTDLQQFCSYLDSDYQLHSIEGINHLIVRSWVVSLIEAGLSARSVNRKITVLKTWYKHLLRQQLVSINPMLKVQAPKLSKRLTLFVEKGNMIRLLDHSDFGTDFNGIRNQLVIELFYATGIRLAELIGLRLKDVDLYSCSLKVMGKRQKQRIVPFSESLKKKIEGYLELRKSVKIRSVQDKNEDCFFVLDNGKKLYEKFVYRLINNYLSMVTTIEKKSPHVLRHTFATHMLDNGADINAIKELLGHASLSATQIYTHNSVEKLKAIHKQAHPRS